jgi:hypothetical protein
MIYIYQHLGLGDHIICNGLIRNIISINETYMMFVKPHNFNSVSFMFRDILNLKYIQTDDAGAINTLNLNSDINNKIIIGFSSKFGISWDEFFYYQHSIDFKKRWSDFKITRDYHREFNLFNKLNPNNENFILIHKNGSDSIDRINNQILNDKIKKIFVENLTGNIFDYLLLAEKADEIHCIDSSFIHLIDSIITKNKLFYHCSYKQRSLNNQHKLLRNWILI